METTHNENNILIAKFCDAKVIAEYFDKDGNLEHVLLDFERKENYPDNSRYHSSNCLKYHLLYEWLMPVMKKITSIEGPMAAQTYRAVQANFLNLEVMYESIIEFVKWYNEQNNGKY